MDMTRFKRAHWMVLGGTLGALLGTLLFDWYSITVGAGPLGSFTVSASAWDTGVLGKLAVLGALAMLAVAVLILSNNEAVLPVPASLSMLVLGAFVALMALLKFIDIHSHTSFGLWLTVIAGIVAAYGAYEMGGVALPSGIRGRTM